MVLTFSKYQGTGNDFIMIDDRVGCGIDRGDTGIIARLCDRRFGIGADGLILLRNHPDADFEMVYFNADGNESTMCGNGGRSIVAFARKLGIIEQYYHFIAADGPHHATITNTGLISLGMKDVKTPTKHPDGFELNTGSPHFVQFVDHVDQVDVVQQGRAIRQRPEFSPAGINVNFVEIKGSRLKVATYERGVEDETLSCGTGVTAVAIACRHIAGLYSGIDIITKGGNLRVEFAIADETYTHVRLIGPAEHVFDGTIEI